MWFVFAIYGLFIFMVNWKEVYSEPVKRPMWSFLLKVNSWKWLIFFTKSSLLDVYKDSEYNSTAS